MRIVVAGSSGHLGRNLVSTLRGEGHEVVTLVRRPAAGADEITWDPAGSDFDSSVLAGVDAVINLCGAPVAAERWTPEYRQELRDSRIRPTEVLARAVAEASVPVLLNASAAGWYGNSGDREVDEFAPHADDFLATMCADWEAAAAPASEAGARVVLLRTSNVLAADSMMVNGLSPLFKLGLGGKFGSGTQYVPWITLQDWLAAVQWLLAEQVSGPVNLVAPEAVTNAVFTKAFARGLNRPALITVPGLLLKLIGGEAGAELLNGHRMVPKALVGSGFEYAHPTLEAGLAYTFGSR